MTTAAENGDSLMLFDTLRSTARDAKETLDAAKRLVAKYEEEAPRSVLLGACLINLGRKKTAYEDAVQALGEHMLGD